jgi:Domain of unknown function (DUF1707)
MNSVSKDHPGSGLRLSDADRDRAAAELGEHFQAGRLTADELDDRVGRALQARTAADLAPLFADLPAKPPAVTGPSPAGPAPARSAGVPVMPIAILVVIALGGLVSGHPGLFVLVPVLVLLIVRRLISAPRSWTRYSPSQPDRHPPLD